jgi:hypothetical protein
MTTVRVFRLDYAYSGNHVVVPVRLFPAGRPPITVNAVLDTGAAISFFDRALLPILGITDVSSGTKIPLTAANNDPADGYAFPVHLEIFGAPMTVPLTFSPDWPEGTTNLLGMQGFFDQVEVGLDHSARRLYVNI